MFRLISFLFTGTLIFLLSACDGNAARSGGEKGDSNDTSAVHLSDSLSTAYFASGCFWCVEAIFESVEGVEEAVSGYAGGEKSTATYKQVSSGRAGHAETVQVFYDPEIVSYETLLKVFFGSHDPTTLNRQGPDEGPQYRSEIFYTSEEEKNLALEYIRELEAEQVYDDEISTKVSELKGFYKAEKYHQDFERKNPNQPYVQAVSVPRLNRFKEKYPELLKEDH